MTNLDIWAVEFNQTELDKALSNIKREGTNILYTNCISELKTGEDSYISKQYDTCIYNFENDVLILIMRSKNKSNQQVRNYLNQKNIHFHEVRFTYLDDYYEEDTNIPKLWFARDKDVLKTAIKNSKQKGINSCTYYPSCESELVINYQRSDGDNNPFDKLIFKGLVQLDDKYIFIINQNDPRNMTKNDVVSELLNQNMKIYIPLEKYPQELLKEEKGSKVLCKKI